MKTTISENLLNDPAVQRAQTYTPGPWKTLADLVHAGKYPFHDIRFIATSDAQWEEDFDNLEAGDLICSMRDGENTEANARLIAAAPTLLETLQIAEVTILRLETRHGSFSNAQGTLDVIRAAIAKATGAKERAR